MYLLQAQRYICQSHMGVSQIFVSQMALNNYVESIRIEVWIFTDYNKSLCTRFGYQFPQCNYQNESAESWDESPLPCDFAWMSATLFYTRVEVSQLILCFTTFNFKRWFGTKWIKSAYKLLNPCCVLECKLWQPAAKLFCGSLIAIGIFRSKRSIQFNYNVNQVKVESLFSFSTGFLDSGFAFKNKGVRFIKTHNEHALLWYMKILEIGNIGKY